MATREVQPFDSLATAAVAHELSAVLAGARVEKIQQPDRLEVVWTLRGKGSRRLLFSARGPFSRVVLTERRIEAPLKPPGFCMLLRKYLEGGRIRRVAQLGLERAIGVEIDTRDDLGDPVVRTFLAELTGNHSNLILLEGELGGTPRILAALRPVTETMSRVRQILPGLPYDPPPIDPGRHDPRAGGVRQALARGGTVAKALHGYFHSLSRLAIGQIQQAAGLAGDRPAGSLEAEEVARLEAVWGEAFDNLAEGRFFPRLVVGQPWDYALLPVDGLGSPGVPPAPGATPTAIPGGSRQDAGAPVRKPDDLAGMEHEGVRSAGLPPAPSATPSDAPISALLDAYYADRWEEREAEALRLLLASTIAEERNRLDTRIAQSRETLAQAEAADAYRRWGDLLLTWQGQVEPGAEQAILLDPGSGEEVVVPLDPGRSPAENAQRHYKAYKKALSARQVQERMLEATLAESAWWAERAADVEAAASRADLEDVATLVKDDTGAASARPGADAGPERYRSADGLEILVGRNNKQNDLLTGRVARPEDWWFHAQKAPGSHVIVRAPASGATLPAKTCAQAAQLAAWFSKARTDTRVPVAFTRRKYVRRKPGAAPGFVTYDHERIVLVQPDGDEVAGILRLS